MGLDQYLKKKTYVKNWDHQPIKWDITALRGDKPSHIRKERVYSIEEEVMYWRKANHIHKWFVDHCQDGEDDCRNAYVSRKQLQQLVDALEKVNSNHSIAPELLPVQKGFFFGGIEYDEHYFRKNEETLKILKEELSSEKDDDHWIDYYYRSNW